MLPVSQLDEFVFDYGKPLVFLDRVESVNTEDSGVILSLGTLQYTRQLLERYGTFVEIGSEAGPSVTAYMKIGFVSDNGTVRVQTALDPKYFDRTTPMMVGPAVDLTNNEVRVTTNDNVTTITSSIIQVSIAHYPFSISIKDSAGFQIWSSLPTSTFQHAPTGMTDIHGASMSDGWPWFFRRMLPFGFATSSDGEDIQMFTTARLGHDEHVYGFGESYFDLDHRGERVDIWQTNATGNTWPESYKNIPFFMSSRGYGLFVNSSRRVSFHLGDLSRTRYSIQNQSPVLDLFFFYGPDYSSILPRYSELTGKPALPPLWSFGIWMSRMSYDSQDQVEEVATELQKRSIPCDVIHIDTDWFNRPWINDLTFSEERFPNPKRMIQFLRDRGMRLSLWQIPYISVDSSFYQEGAEEGCFALDASGDPWLLDGFFGKAAIVDYSNPDAAHWMKEKLDDLFELGVSVIKTDFGEGAPPGARYHSVDGADMHNLYPLLYNKAFYEKTKQHTGDGIVWARSAFAGSQRYPVHWGGDPAALWDDLGNLWHGGLGLGLSGIPFWSIDIGGFGGTPSAELYTRWIQVGMFVSHPRAHGPIGREPWVFGETAEQVFRAYGQIRYQLLPYIWTEAVHATKAMAPFHQPLLFQWQSDPNTATIDDEYLFGRNVLVAPVMDQSNSRSVYLPEGHWVDLWTDEMLVGNRWIKVEAPLTHLPLYVKADSVLPMIDPVLSTDDADFTRVHLHVYPQHGFETTIDLPGERLLHVQVTKDHDGYQLQASGAPIVLIPHLHGCSTKHNYDGDPIVLATGKVQEDADLSVESKLVLHTQIGFIPE